MGGRGLLDSAIEDFCGWAVERCFWCYQARNRDFLFVLTGRVDTNNRAYLPSESYRRARAMRVRIIIEHEQGRRECAVEWEVPIYVEILFSDSSNDTACPPRHRSPAIVSSIIRTSTR